MQMSVVSSFLRRSGGFFLRRTFGSDRLYKVVFSLYLQALLGSGDAPMEFFIEGTRSRTAKSLHPKLGRIVVYLTVHTSPFTSHTPSTPAGICYTLPPHFTLPSSTLHTFHISHSLLHISHSLLHTLNSPIVHTSRSPPHLTVPTPHLTLSLLHPHTLVSHPPPSHTSLPSSTPHTPHTLSLLHTDPPHLTHSPSSTPHTFLFSLGLLSMVVEPYLSGCLPDILLLPVSISYERTLEEELFARELLGTPKPKESTRVGR